MSIRNPIGSIVTTWPYHAHSAEVIPEMPRMLREDEAKRLRPRSRSEEVSFDEDVIYRLCGDGERAPRPECLCVRRGQPADLQDRVPGDPLRDARGAAGHL